MKEYIVGYTAMMAMDDTYFINGNYLDGLQMFEKILQIKNIELGETEKAYEWLE